jgi:hypothetical protein
MDEARPEAFFRLSESLRAVGKPSAAKELLEKAVERGVADRSVWDLWYAIAAVDLKESVEELRGYVDKRAEGDRGGDGGGEPRGYASDLRWALAQLAEDRVLRLNCGGEEYVGDNGVIWDKDRFALGGFRAEKRRRAIEGTEDPPLYLTERWFGTECRPPRGYRIPAPTGRYRIVLAFAEVHFREPGKRRFGVVIEGDAVLEDYEPKIDKAETFVFEDEAVDDGHVDIELIHDVGNPKIAAITIERID